MPENVIVRLAEATAPFFTRSDLERALVREQLFSFSDFQERNYGWNKKDFITYTLLEKAYSREGTAKYLRVLDELLPDSEKGSLEKILSEEKARLAVPTLQGRRPQKLRTRLRRPRRKRRRTQRKKEIFLAHSSTDNAFTERLAKSLVRAGVRVWFDEWEIKVGDSIVDKIQDGLRTHSHLGLVLSPQALKSRWVRRELNAGLMAELRSKHVVVLPILHKGCPIPTLLKEKRYADFRSNYLKGLREILDAL